MSYSSDMDGLALFAAPFRSIQASGAAAASRPQRPKAAVSPARQPETVIPKPVNRKASETHAQQPDIPDRSVPGAQKPAVQTERGNVPEPEQRPQAGAQAPARAQSSIQVQPEEPKKELSLDMSDCTVPAGKPLDASEAARRKAHEEAEAKRKTEWEARQPAKKQEEDAALAAVKSMSDTDIVSASTERIRTEVERLTRRNMKECVAGHIQDLCHKDPAFARRTMHPHKSMTHCFQYINRRAKDYIQQEMKDNDIRPENSIYGGDVPDGLVFQWAEDYFNDQDAQEDHAGEEKPVPRPYAGTASRPEKAAKKQTEKKQTEKKQGPKENDYEQMSLPGV